MLFLTLQSFVAEISAILLWLFFLCKLSQGREGAVWEPPFDLSHWTAYASHRDPPDVGISTAMGILLTYLGTSPSGVTRKAGLRWALGLGTGQDAVVIQTRFQPPSRMGAPPFIGFPSKGLYFFLMEGGWNFVGDRIPLDWNWVSLSI